MLEIDGISVTYGPVTAVKDVSLTVGATECIALLGANGAGKTSTLRAVSGLAAHQGTISFDGAVLRRTNAEETTRRGLIHVPEGRHIFPTLSVHENLQVGTSAACGRTGGYSIDDIYDLFVPLQALRDRGGWALSGGEQQMVAIGRALVGQPRLLMLDEPSLGLAPVIVTVVFDVLREIASRTPMLLVEQSTVMALKICDRAYVLQDGRVVLEDEASALAANEALLDSYLGQRDLDSGGPTSVRPASTAQARRPPA